VEEDPEENHHLRGGRGSRRNIVESGVKHPNPKMSNMLLQ
jgi:hypothetical protein